MLGYYNTNAREIKVIFYAAMAVVWLIFLIGVPALLSGIIWAPYLALRIAFAKHGVVLACLSIIVLNAIAAAAFLRGCDLLGALFRGKRLFEEESLAGAGAVFFAVVWFFGWTLLLLAIRLGA